MNFRITPSTASASYSDVPLSVWSQFNYFDKFKYIVNICYDNTIISNMTAVSSGTSIYTRTTVSTPHKFKTGDSVFIWDNQYQGYYNIVKIVSANVFDLDLILSQPYDTTLASRSSISKYYRYKGSPNPEERFDIDLSNTLKDFVKSTLLDSNNVLDGSSTRFDYFIVVGSEYNFQFQFTDNIFSSGSVGFNNPSITSLAGIPFQAGDTIFIQQDLYSWDYTDNFFSTGAVGFTGLTNHNLEVGDVITILGQATFPSYNTTTVVTEVIDSTNIVTDLTFLGSTPVEGGQIFAEITPEYNGEATILDVYIDPTLGLVVVTDKGFTTSTPPISGIITYSNSTLTRTLNQATRTSLVTYNSRFDRSDYLSMGGYSKDLYKNNYVYPTGNKFSTIINGEKNYNRIEYSAKSWLLAHLNTNRTSIKYTFYDSDLTTPLGVSYIPNNTGKVDFYAPVGLLQVISNDDRVDVGAFDLEASQQFIKYYKVTVCSAFDLSTEYFEPVLYRINPDCGAGVEVYNLMWKDALGSWCTYPFKYKSTDVLDVTRNTYYKKESFREQVGDFLIHNLDAINRGVTTFSTVGVNSVKLTSGWVDDYENKLFKDMMMSTEVYLQMYDERVFISEDGEFLIDENNDYITDENGDFIIVGSDEYYDYILKIGKLIPVTLQPTNIEFKKSNSDMIYNYSPTVTIGYKDYRY